MNRTALTAAAGTAGALALVGALAGGYELGRGHVTTRTAIATVTRTATVPAAPPRVRRHRSHPSPGAATTAAASGAAPPVIYDCQGHPVVAPSEIVLACADAGIGIKKLTWSGWGHATASASGNAWQNTCNPNCAQGTFIYTPATVTVSAFSGGRYTYMQISDPQQPDISHGYLLTVNGQP
jgi:hypothetical protein